MTHYRKAKGFEMSLEIIDDTTCGVRSLWTIRCYDGMDRARNADSGRRGDGTPSFRPHSERSRTK